MESLITTYERPRLRTVALAVATLIAGAAILTPAVGEAAAFLTKAKAKKLFLENTRIATAQGTVPSGGGVAIQANCPPGLQATNGGVDSPVMSTTGSTGDTLLTDESRPVMSGARSIGWYVEVANPTANPVTATAYAVSSK